MADAVYAVVDKSKKGKKHSLAKNEIAEANSFDSPVYDKTDHSADTPPVPQRDEAFNSEYSMITLDNMYSTVNENTRPRGAEQGSGSTTSVITTKDKKVPKKKRLEDENKGCKLFICVFITIAVVTTITLICLVILFAEVLKLKAQTTSTQQPFTYRQTANETEDFSGIMFQLQQLNKTLGNDIQQLNSSIEMVQQDQETSTQELIEMLDDHIQQLNNSIGVLTLDQESSNNTIWELLAQFRQDIISIEDANQDILAPSCAALIALSPPSGYYWVRTSNGSAVRVYCDMTRSCGNITGGWTRVAELNMTNSSHQCPSGLTLRTESDPNIRACVTASTVGCVSIPIDIPYSYSRVCGRVIAYQVGNTNAFHGSHRTHAIDSNYVDGISLTHHNPREHIWTFAAGLRENGVDHGESICPCAGNPGAAPPPFVGDDYFCEAGVEEHLESNTSTLYSNDPLWDGRGCTGTNLCCSFNDPPWFYKQLPQPTTDNIEMRVCKDENVSNEDVAIEIVDIYVQ